MKKIRIIGPYNKEIISLCLEHNINDFIFDCRPLQVNFIQLAKLLEILQETKAELTVINLLFENESPIVINKILSDIKKLNLPLKLYFNCSQKNSLYDQYELPFAWNYKGARPFQEIAKSKWFHEVVCDVDTIEKLSGEGRLSEFHKVLKERPDIKTSLTLSWKQSFDSSLGELISTETFNLPIIPEFATSYRQIDRAKLSGALHKLQNLIR